MANDSTKIMGSPAGTTAGAEAELQCPHCAAELPEEEQFCPQCGYQRGSWAGTAEPGVPASLPAAYELHSTSGQVWPVYPGENEIGRGEVAIMLSNPYASRHHARITVSLDGTATIEDLGSSNGTVVDGRPIPANVPQPLAVGAEFSIGQETFSLAEVSASRRDAEAEPSGPATMTAEGAEPPAATGVSAQDEAGEPPSAVPEVAADVVLSPWTIVFESGDQHNLPIGETILGRKAATSGIVVAGDGYVSGTHCMLQADFDKLSIEDLGSTNGTFVEGAQLEPGEALALQEGSSVRIGQTTFTVGLSTPGAAPTDEEPAGE